MVISFRHYRNTIFHIVRYLALCANICNNFYPWALFFSYSHSIINKILIWMLNLEEIGKIVLWEDFPWFSGNNFLYFRRNKILQNSRNLLWNILSKKTYRIHRIAHIVSLLLLQMWSHHSFYYWTSIDKE